MHTVFPWLLKFSFSTDLVLSIKLIKKINKCLRPEKRNFLHSSLDSCLSLYRPLKVQIFPLMWETSHLPVACGLTESLAQLSLYSWNSTTVSIRYPNGWWPIKNTTLETALPLYHQMSKPLPVWLGQKTWMK